LVLILVPVWLVCLALAVSMQIEGGGEVPIQLSLVSSEAHPVLTGEFSQRYRQDPLQEAGLQAGDLLVRVGKSDLRGVGTLTFRVIARDEAEGHLSVPVVFERNGERHKTSISLTPISSFRPWQLMAVCLAVSALLLQLRTRSTRSVVHAYILAASCTLICFCPFDPIDVWLYFSIIPWALLFPLWLRFVQVFPDGVLPEGRWQRLWPWLFVVHGVFQALYNFGGWFIIGDAGIGATVGLGLVAIIAVATNKYRRGDAVARRQIRWVLLGLYGAGAPSVVATLMAAADPELTGAVFLAYWAFPLFPIALVIAVARFNLFDVDRLISTTASYNIMLVLFGTGILVLVPRLAEACADYLGVEPGVSDVVLAFLLTGVVVPTHRRLRPQLDRLFFDERFSLDRGIADLLRTLSHNHDARVLTTMVGESLSRLVKPEAFVIYMHIKSSYAAVFVDGRAVPTVFAANGSLIAALAERRTPLCLSSSGRRPDAAALGPFDRAALETLQAELVVPIRQGVELLGFLCLGPKRSGDVYTSTDISHLSSVSETMSREFKLFDHERTAREAKAMHEELQRYVPGAVVEQLAAGGELLSEEREVSVLFVDIKGYTSFSESREAGEIFSAVNIFTTTVSRIVERHSGHIVEFNGDGMMTVFGAPNELAHKEAAAVEAGIEIVEAVSTLELESPQGDPAQISVGVGIATGSGFSGCIQSVDRMIWTVIGNTTNLAARLESLTREMGAAVIIDRATWQRAQPAADRFQKMTAVQIRGRSHVQDVYMLESSEPQRRTAGG
jgi:class 3 adenylate cyclase